MPEQHASQQVPMPPREPGGPHGRRRILMVSRGLDPVGTGRQMELAAAGFQAAGWNVHVAMTTAGGGVAARLARAGHDVHRLSTRPVVDGTAIVRLVRLARRIGLGSADTILAWGRAQTSLAAAAKMLSPRTRCIGHLAAAPRGTLARLALRQVDRVIASSGAMARACERAGVAATKIDTIPPGADAASAVGLSRDQIAIRLGLDPEKLWTLCVAPLVADARLERLLWAIDQLGVVHRRLEHVLVGSGPLRDRLLRRARAQRVDERLHLFPHLDCLPDLLREARLVWQSGEVACGGALLDGMAVGIPAVAVASDAARQLIVDGATGRIVGSDPESEFPRRALGIIEDDVLAARYGSAARARVAAEFPVERMVAGIIAAVDR